MRVGLAGEPEEWRGKVIWMLHFFGEHSEYIAIYDHPPVGEEREPGYGFRLDSETIWHGALPTTFPINRTFKPE